MCVVLFLPALAVRVPGGDRGADPPKSEAPRDFTGPMFHVEKLGSSKVRGLSRALCHLPLQ